METDWHERLRLAIKAAMKNGRSMRSISLDAGLSVNYVDQIMKGTQPTVEKFLRICDVLEVDAIEILTGTKRGPYAMKALEMFGSMSESQQKAFLNYLAALSPEIETQD